MTSTTSDHDMSDSSSSGASYLKYSPERSPVQQVPQLTTDLTQLSCADKDAFFNTVTTPYLQIIEQPQSHFRFRYGSEMTGTHGCLVGKSVGSNKTKTHPTVQLVNYQGAAIIRCHLVQHDNSEEHPHKLVDDDHDDVSKQVPEKGSYIVAFRGIGIIHTAKRDVSAFLQQRLMERNGNINGDARDIQAQCDLKAKRIQLNIVRLKFSAHDIRTNEEICEPVFSDPIYNLKSSATNKLKICRMSHSSGSAAGGQDVFMFVEKVNKKHTMIRFFELDENGGRVWTGVGQFSETDVHHQVGIVFRTPPYKNPKTPEDVTVYIELVRTSDGGTSEPKEFKYKADPLYKLMKKRKMRPDPSTEPIKRPYTNQSNEVYDIPSVSSTVSMYTMTPASSLPNVASPYQSSYQTHQSPYTPVSYDASQSLDSALVAPGNPMWNGCELPAAEPSVGMFQLSSVDIPEYTEGSSPDGLVEDPSAPDDPQFGPFLRELFKNYDVNTLDDKLLENISFENIQLNRMVPDSPGPATSCKKDTDIVTPQGPSFEEFQVQDKPEGESIKAEYNAFYKAEDGAEVKKLVTDVCTMIKNNNYLNKQEIRNRFERLFDIRLSNGDTLLHMTLFSSPSTLKHIVQMIHNVKATHLLDCANDRQKTTLHLAVLNDMPNIVSLLVAKGANPMVKDIEELNVVHYAVKYKSCLEPLLDAIKKYEVPCDLNDCNSEKQSALHMAVVEGSEHSARLLLQHGASSRVRDEYGRTPLHLAAYDDRLAVTKTLLEFIPLSEVDVIDNSGNTALQIVCGGTVREHTVEIARLLLQNKADPLKNDDNVSAWRLVRNKPSLKALLRDYVTTELDEDDYASATEDEYESADEFDSGEDISMSSMAEALEEVRQTNIAVTI